MHDTTLYYPRLLRRIQATLIDSVITPLIFIVIAFALSYVGIANDYLRVSLALGPALSFEPLLVAFTGATIGHHAIGLKVRRISVDKPINVLLAYIRFFLKWILGLPSLIFILVTKKHQAFHDMIVRSIVVNYDQSLKDRHEAMKERNFNDPNYIYPAASKRVLVIVFYSVVACTGILYLFNFAVNSNCLLSGICTRTDFIAVNLLMIAFWLFPIAFLVLGWNAKLIGCRRKPKKIEGLTV